MCKAVESCDSISASFLIAWGFSWSGTIAWEFLTRVSQKSTCHDRKKPHQLILPSRNMESIVLVTTKINVCHNRHMRKTSLRWCMMNAGVPYLLGRTGKQTDGLGTHQDTNYRPRSRGDNMFGSVHRRSMKHKSIHIYHYQSKVFVCVSVISCCFDRLHHRGRSRF